MPLAVSAKSQMKRYYTASHGMGYLARRVYSPQRVLWRSQRAMQTIQFLTSNSSFVFGHGAPVFVLASTFGTAI